MINVILGVMGGFADYAIWNDAAWATVAGIAVTSLATVARLIYMDQKADRLDDDS